MSERKYSIFSDIGSCIAGIAAGEAAGTCVGALLEMAGIKGAGRFMRALNVVGKAVISGCVAGMCAEQSRDDIQDMIDCAKKLLDPPEPEDIPEQEEIDG